MSESVIANKTGYGESTRNTRHTQSGRDKELPRCKALSQRTPAERVPQVGAHCRQLTDSKGDRREGKSLEEDCRIPLQVKRRLGSAVCFIGDGGVFGDGEVNQSLSWERYVLGSTRGTTSSAAGRTKSHRRHVPARSTANGPRYGARGRIRRL